MRKGGATPKTGKHRETNHKLARQSLLILAMLSGLLAWIEMGKPAGGSVVFGLLLIALEALLILPGVFHRHRLKASGIKEIDRLSGEEFEDFLQALLTAKGYGARLTPKGSAFGADLVLEKDGERAVVQANNRRSRDVGLKAVPEANTAQAYNGTSQAMVITTRSFTQQAIDLAGAARVELWDRDRLAEEILATSPGGKGQLGTRWSASLRAPF